MTPLEPFVLALDLATGRLAPHTTRIVRRVSDMRGLYDDAEAEERLAAGDNLWVPKTRSTSGFRAEQRKRRDAGVALLPW